MELSSRSQSMPFTIFYPVAIFWVPLVILGLPIAAAILISWMIWIFFLRPEEP